MRTRNTDKEALVKQKAIELLVELGFEGFSMNKLAKACGISVATLYIYYADKDDLIKKIGIELGKGFFEGALKGFSPEMHFAEGLRIQWNNRLNYTLENKAAMQCWEVIRHSPHNDYVLQNSVGNFKEILGTFTKNARDRGELVHLPFEVFWSIAYAPMYTLLRFEAEGKSMGNKPFKLTEEMKDQVFTAVIKALTPDKQ
ncbi:TetR/AcrR family transcriptional regulator [Flavobacterium sp. RHBU_3]|uniref:TetR/AcrR family transcriptional regulator n=1 Tax=Flavobacterium sp. RHBU_3 TaxID=3391184 RepID=UPI0039854AA5